jgi:ABC-type multidrug transport system permease subunit
VIGAISLLTLLAGFAYHGVAWGKLPSSLAWLVVSGVGLFGWFAALQMLFSNQKAASVVSTVLLFPLMMAGGSFFPLAALPDFIANIGRLSPNGFIADRLTTELTSAASWTFDAGSWAIVGAMTLSGLAICGWRLGTGFARR